MEILALKIQMVTFPTVQTSLDAVVDVIWAQKLMVVFYRGALGAVLFLNRVITLPAVYSILHLWIVLPQKSRIWPAGVLTPASGG